MDDETGKLIADIRKDREEGTPGPWEPSGGNGRVLSHWDGIGFWEIANASETTFSGDSGAKYSTAGDSEANARRIARVPQMETALLAAEELAGAMGRCIEELMSVYHGEYDGVWADEDFDRLEATHQAALAAYRIATGGQNG